MRHQAMYNNNVGIMGEVEQVRLTCSGDRYNARATGSNNQRKGDGMVTLRNIPDEGPSQRQGGLFYV